MSAFKIADGYRKLTANLTARCAAETASGSQCEFRASELVRADDVGHLVWLCGQHTRQHDRATS